MANCDRMASGAWFPEGLMLAWAYAFGALVAYPVIRLLIRADATRLRTASAR
jgi:hypothetical protein